jgi:hypothetical protein
MKRILLFIFLIGLFAIGWSTPPPDNVSKSAKTGFVMAADQVQADVIYAADETALPTSDTPAPLKWVDENLLTMASGILLLVYEFLALKMPTSKSISILGNLYKLLTWFVPDKSNKGGQFSIRDKL